METLGLSFWSFIHKVILTRWLFQEEEDYINKVH